MPVPVLITPQFVKVTLPGKDQPAFGVKPGGAATLAQATYIDGLFRTLVGRAVTYPEYLAYTKQLDSGVPRAQIVAALLEHAPAPRGAGDQTFYGAYRARADRLGCRRA